ncbi:MAG: ABC transporter substrate-binding protein [Anaerolineae bacterium]|nr:ABC transporter substrate-binding protein [Anaerolineae bacterium]
MRKMFLIVVALLSMATAAVAQDSAPSGEIVISMANDPTSLYLPRAADTAAYNAALPLYDTLVGRNEKQEIIPSLAESWERSEDGKQYTFKLRHDVMFQNGEKFTADAVVETWIAGKDPSNLYPQLYSFASKVEAVDDYTVKISTESPQVLFLSKLLQWGIVAPTYMRQVGIEEFEKKPVGSGPFRLVERVSGDRIVMEANPDYWRKGYPKLARVTFRIIPDSSTRLAAIQTGEIDIANRLSADDVATLKDVSTVKVISYQNDSLYYVGFKNVGNGVGTPLENVKVRQALNYAVNRQGIIDAIFNGGASLVSGFLLASDLGYDNAIQPYPYDPEKAKALLAEAGYEKGFSISIGCPTDAYLNINEVCLAIQRDLSAVGVDATVEFKTSNSYWSEKAYGSVGPMYVDGWASGSGEALDRLQGALDPTGFYNTWVDTKLSDQINTLAATFDRDARAKLYKDLQKYMYDNPPFIYLYTQMIFEAVNSKVEGYSPTSTELINLTDISISK